MVEGAISVEGGASPLTVVEVAVRKEEAPEAAEFPCAEATNVNIAFLIDQPSEPFHPIILPLSLPDQICRPSILLQLPHHHPAIPVVDHLELLLFVIIQVKLLAVEP